MPFELLGLKRDCELNYLLYSFVALSLKAVSPRWHYRVNICRYIGWIDKYWRYLSIQPMWLQILRRQCFHLIRQFIILFQVLAREDLRSFFFCVEVSVRPKWTCLRLKKGEKTCVWISPLDNCLQLMWNSLKLILVFWTVC